jgi:hypothetical protein
MTLGAWGRLRFALEGTPTHLMELFNALAAMGWGLWLLLPTHAFAADPFLYRELARLAPDVVWGVAAVALGALGLAALLGDGRESRARIAVGLFFGWLFLVLLLGLSTSWRTTAVPIYTLLALSAGWVYVRLERDRRGPG